MRHFSLALLTLSLAAPAPAQEDFRHGRIRAVEPGVTIQRASETGAEEAVPNLPFFPGDRVWTDGAGRAEFQFRDGSLVRLDRRSKLDYVTHDEGRAELIVLRLWSGTLSLRPRDGREGPELEVETPSGLVTAIDRGVYRIDVDGGETRLSVYEGEATLESGRRRVTVDAGERSYARGGGSPEEPYRFDTGERDAFARWEAEREDREYAETSRRYLPEELGPYASEFESHGSWYYETEIGYVWRPYVAPGWRPYWDGRWVWTPGGWTWVPHEPWGWAPFHYGRWGHSAALGWYWIPGRVWGPAWVSWAVSGDYVGWCPLGYRDRPVLVYGSRNRGFAVPRGSLATELSNSAWTFARRGDVGARDLARRRVEVDAAVVRDLRVIESPRQRPTRDFRGVEAEAIPRTVRTRPTPGDTVPELRTDPATTIPFPGARARRRDVEREDVPRYQRQERGETARERAPRPSRAGEVTASPVDRAVRPADQARPESKPEPPPAARPRDRNAEDARRPDPDRDVLRQLFRPLSEPRSRGGDDGESRPRGGFEPRPRAGEQAQPRGGDEARPRSGDDSRRRGEGAPRGEPRAVAPPPRSAPPPKAAPSPSSGERAAPRRKRDER